MHNFRELNVWKKSVEFTTKFYSISEGFPKSELYGLTSQARRCCCSIPSNIAEGAGRNSNEQFCYFLNVAIGSSFELETQIEILKNIKILDKLDYDELIPDITHIQKMLIKLLQNFSNNK